jgi:uncharacterized protein
MAQQLETTLTKHKRPHLAKLLEAAKTCKRGPLKRYLEAGGTPDAVVELEEPGNKIFRVPLLHSAVLSHHCGAEHVGSVETLLSAGARLDTIGYTPDGSDRSCVIWAAVLSCCTEPLKLLLKRGADPCYVPKSNGMTALHTAAIHGLPESCELLLIAGGERALNEQAAGLSHLYVAVATGQLEVVKLMLKHGAAWKTVASQRDSLLAAAVTADIPLMPGSKRDSLAVLNYLLSEGLHVNTRSAESATLLYAAAVHNNIAAVQLLLEHGADCNLQNTDGSFPLSTFCQSGHAAVVEVLLQNGADITITREAEGYLGVTVLMIAAHNGHIDVVRVLLAKGAAVNTLDDGGRSALTLAAAASKNRAALVKLLLQHGADPQQRAELGDTALLSAVVSGDAECTQLLVHAGTDVNGRCGLALPTTAELAESAGVEGMTVTTVNGVATAVLADGSLQPALASLRNAIANDMSKTVLMAADTPAVVKVLLAAGADVHRTTDQGNTCLHTAAALNYPAPVICLLIKAGVNLRAVNREGKTAAAVAHDKGNTLAAALLNRAAKDV